MNDEKRHRCRLLAGHRRLQSVPVDVQGASRRRPRGARPRSAIADNHNAAIKRPPVDPYVPDAPQSPPQEPAPRSQIALSAGVALPQTLPEGTAFGFSVDYRFVVGAPASGGRYLWVIVPAQAAAVELPVELEPAGTLQTFVTTLRPEHGPFQSFLAEREEGGTRRLSALEDMR
jgi:hypothetical protein